MLYTYKPMTTVVFSVVLDLNFGLTVRTLNIFDTMYNVFTSFHPIDKQNTEQQVTRARKTYSSLFPPRCFSRYHTNILPLTAHAKFLRNNIMFSLYNTTLFHLFNTLQPLVDVIVGSNPTPCIVFNMLKIIASKRRSNT